MKIRTQGVFLAALAVGARRLARRSVGRHWRRRCAPRGRHQGDRGQPRSQRRRPHQRPAPPSRGDAGLHRLQPGMIALDLSAGGGYTTELLARSIGPTGKVYGQSRPRIPTTPAPTPAAPEGNANPSATPSAAAPPPPAAAPRPSPVALADRDEQAQGRQHRRRADRRGRAAVRGSGPGRAGRRQARSRDPDVQLSRPRLPERRSRGDEQGGVQGAEARRHSMSSPTIPAGPAPASPNRARCTGSRRRSCARKSRPPASSWSPRATSCATPTTRATRTRPTRRCPRTSSS